MGDVPVRTGEQFMGWVVMRWAAEARPVVPGEAQTSAPFHNLRVEAVQNVGAMEFALELRVGQGITSIRRFRARARPSSNTFDPAMALTTGQRWLPAEPRHLRLAAYGRSASGCLPLGWQGFVPNRRAYAAEELDR